MKSHQVAATFCKFWMWPPSFFSLYCLSPSHSLSLYPEPLQPHRSPSPSSVLTPIRCQEGPPMHRPLLIAMHVSPSQCLLFLCPRICATGLINTCHTFQIVWEPCYETAPELLVSRYCTLSSSSTWQSLLQSCLSNLTESGDSSLY